MNCPVLLFLTAFVHPLRTFHFECKMTIQPPADPKRNSLIYIAYSTRLSTAADDGSVSSGRYRTSICALKVPDAPAPAPAAAAAAAAPADAANN